MLKTYQIKETIIVENKKVFAYSSELNKKRILDPCEVRKYLIAQIAKTEIERETAQAIVDNKNSEINEMLRLNNEIAGLGYCALDTPMYEKIDGVVLKDESGNAKIKSYTHSASCKNKEV